MMILADIFMYVLLNKEIYSLALFIVVLLGPMGDQYYSEWVTLLSSIYVHNFICIYLIIINILLLLLLLLLNFLSKNIFIYYAYQTPF